jgi:predicted CoA-binding protein
MLKKTLVLGASENPARYSYLAIEKLRKHHHPVVAIGLKKGKVNDVEIEIEKKPFEAVDTVTMYIGKQHQPEYYNYIVSLHPKRIIFNPGAENEELLNLAKSNGIEALEACTLVMLSTNQY